jgi:hypothetical protein
MSDTLSGMVPIWVDLGYRYSPLFYAGAYLQYGFGSLNTGSKSPAQGCTSSGASCSMNDLRTGIEVDFHLIPDGVLDPWLGVGVGVEIQNFSASGVGGTGSIQSVGYEFVNAHLGGNWNITPDLTLGPFVSFSLDQIQTVSAQSPDGSPVPGTNVVISDRAIHEWFLIGVRSTYGFKI